jgi:ParB/RepB/Spo0J family partition protein
MSQFLSKLPKELQALVTVEEMPDKIIVRAKQFLGSEVFKQLADAVRALGGTYVPAGKLSHFVIPKEFVKPKEEREATAPLPPLSSEVIKIPIARLVEGKFKVRRWVDPEELSKLRESIRRQKDVISPIPVRPVGDKFEILGGHRRVEAAKQAGLTEVTVRVFHPKTEAEAWSIAYCEDALKENWSPIAKAEAFRRMQKDGMSLSDISLHTGETISTIEHLLDILKLPEDVQEIVDNGKLGIFNALQLLKLKDRPEDLLALAIRASEEGWTRDRLAEEIARILPISAKEEKFEGARVPPEKLPVSGKEGKFEEISKPSMPPMEKGMETGGTTFPPPVCEICGKSDPKPEFTLTDKAGVTHYYHIQCRRDVLRKEGEEKREEEEEQPPSKPPTKKFVIDLDYGLYEQFEKACRILGRTPAEVITTFIATFIEEAARKQAALARPNESDVPQLLLKYAKRDTMNGVGRVVLSEFLSETGVSDKEFWNAVHQLRNQGVQVRVQGNVVLVGG